MHIQNYQGMAHLHCRLDLGLSLLHISFHHTVELVSCIHVSSIVYLACTSYCMRSIRPIHPSFRLLLEKKFYYKQNVWNSFKCNSLEEEARCTVNVTLNRL